jgi:phosphoglycerate kinase
MHKKTIRDIDVRGKRVLVRAPLNVPIENGKVMDSFRLESLLPTLRYLLIHKAKPILISHHSDETNSLSPVAPVLAKLLDISVEFIPDCIGEAVNQTAKNLQSDHILLLENLRFHAEEKANDLAFAKQLASLAEVYVDDDFTTMHREHASIVGIPKFLPAVAGLQVEKEIKSLRAAIDNPKRPLVVIIGGAKLETKIEFLQAFLQTAQTIAIGGIMANTFLADRHFGAHTMGNSVYEKNVADKIVAIVDEAKARNVKLIVPDQDVAVGEGPEAKVRREIMLNEIQANDMILDLGPKSIDQIKTALIGAGTIIWNGPLGLTENEHFRAGSLSLAHAIADSEATSLVGGGDTAAFIHQAGMDHAFDLASTGGGATLEFLSGHNLPGIDALQDK